MRAYVWLGDDHDFHVRDYRNVERAKKATIYKPYRAVWKGSGPDPRKIANEQKFTKFIERIAERRLK